MHKYFETVECNVIDVNKLCYRQIYFQIAEGLFYTCIAVAYASQIRSLGPYSHSLGIV